MRLPDGWTVGREKTENGVRKVTLVKMPPLKERMERAAREADAVLADLEAEGIPITPPSDQRTRDRIRATAGKHGWYRETAPPKPEDRVKGPPRA